MKKIFFLCSIMMCCLSGYASITLVPSFSSIVTPAPGGQAPNGITAVNIYVYGETSMSYVTNVFYSSHSVTVSPVTAQFDALPITNIRYYNPVGGVSTGFTMNITTATPFITQSYAVTYTIGVNTSDHSFQFLTFTITVTPSGLHWNAYNCANFTKQGCGTGYYGPVVNYCIQQSLYSSSVSQAAADAQATTASQTWVNNNTACVPCKYSITNEHILLSSGGTVTITNGGSYTVTNGGNDNTLYYTFTCPSTSTFTFSVAPYDQNHFCHLETADPPAANGTSTTFSNDFYMIANDPARPNGIPITLSLTDACGTVDTYVIYVHL